MGFDFVTLKKLRGQRVGKIYNIPVLSISKSDYEKGNYVEGFYLVIYDDKSVIVKNGMTVGMLGKNGEIVHWTPTPYKIKEEAKVKVEEVKVEEVEVKAKTIPLVDAGGNDFFERVQREIEETLKKKID
jgi:hypothetical protein